MITMRNLHSNINIILRSLHASTSTVVVSWLPQVMYFCLHSA